MSRLTDRCWRNLDPWECCGQNFHCSRKLNDDGGCINGCIVPKLYKHLAEYEDLEEQGLLIKLPCKVRTEVFYICQKNTIALEKGKIYKAVVSGLYAFEKGVCVTIQIYDDYGCTELEEINNFGKTVFLTKEEAEKALKRLECAE